MRRPTSLAARAARALTTAAPPPPPPPPGRPLDVAVVGSGPAGCYAASQLLKRLGDRVRVAVLDRLPTPFGLVRSGVAPDHQDTKNVTNQFDRLLADPRVAFAGGLDVGAVGGRVGDPASGLPLPVPLSAVRAAFDAVVLAHGAEGDAGLALPGADLDGVFTARQFVLWANGHPDADADGAVARAVAASRSVAVVGAGNVALDVARLLLTPSGVLAATDIARHAVGPLEAGHGRRRVTLIARRGADAAAFTAKELREAARLPGVAVGVTPPVEGPADPAAAAALAGSRVRKRVFDILGGLPAALPDPPPPSLTFRFLTSPTAFLPAAGDPARVGAVAVATNKIVDGRAVADPSAAAPPPAPLPADLVLLSVGFRTPPLAGAPYDARRCVVPSGEGGRVIEEGGRAPPPPSLAPLYVTGWARRGPSGIIGTNLADADDVAAAVAADAAALTAAAQPRGGLAALAAALPAAPVPRDGWAAIDAVERAAGAAAGAPRVKLTRWGELVEAARKGGG